MLLVLSMLFALVGLVLDIFFLILLLLLLFAADLDLVYDIIVTGS